MRSQKKRRKLQQKASPPFADFFLYPEHDVSALRYTCSYLRSVVLADSKRLMPAAHGCPMVPPQQTQDTQLVWELVRPAGRWLTGMSCSQKYTGHKKERLREGSVKDCRERMENWQSSLLIDAVCCNSDSLGSAWNAVSGLQFTFPINLINEVSYTYYRTNSHN